MTAAETNLTFRVIEYGFCKSVFSFNELQSALGLDMHEISFTRSVLWALDSKSMTPNSVFCTVKPRYRQTGPSDPVADFDDPCMLLPSAIFSYIDHLEIVEARRAAKESKKLAWIAIWISVFVGASSLIVGLLQLYSTSS